VYIIYSVNIRAKQLGIELGTVKMLPGDEILSTIKLDPYQNAIPYTEYIITNTEPNNIENT